MSDKPEVIVICGPTASGKTKLGISVANCIDGEIVSADSMQIYKYMDIGTAKPTMEERKLAVHHLIDFVEPDRRYSVADYKIDAMNAIKDILKRKKVPIVVGGTGLYINSLIYNIEFKEEKVDLEYRKQMEKYETSVLYEEAKKIDIEAVKKISINDRKRIIRILEIYNSTGKTKTELEKQSRKRIEYNYKIFVLNMDRDKLYLRINDRVDRMINLGLIDEVKYLIGKYDELPTSMQGLGYKEVAEYLKGKTTKEEMIEKIKQDSRRYAKRQLTWFRSYKGAIWIDAENDNNTGVILNHLCM
ncbi:MAG: tRNA (adenosine(37)-N6)-dimethylallyltransferase MiaA [Clostridia bacterium]|nr:tRNA (adenosine(37)-N6)-dimethylallyltransferase MiaA [Clostridia bacterium]